MSHQTLRVSLRGGWLTHWDSHYSHRGRVEHLPSAKLEASLSPPISFFPTWAHSDGLADCTDRHSRALLRDREDTQSRRTTQRKKKQTIKGTQKNCTHILCTFRFSVSALKGKSETSFICSNSILWLLGGVRNPSQIFWLIVFRLSWLFLFLLH